MDHATKVQALAHMPLPWTWRAAPSLPGAGAGLAVKTGTTNPALCGFEVALLVARRP